MQYLNCDIPPVYCLMRAEYMHDLQEKHGQLIPACLFGLTSIPGRALMFHGLLETGAQFARMPLSAFAHRRDAPALELTEIELWDCFSYYPSVHAFRGLRGLRCLTRGKSGKWYPGQYMFTVDWAGDAYAEDPGEGGHKNAHILKLDNGCFAAQPNNRIYWREPSFVTKPFKPGERPTYKTNSHVWQVEGTGTWRTEDSDRMFYELEEDKDG